MDKIEGMRLAYNKAFPNARQIERVGETPEAREILLFAMEFGPPDLPLSDEEIDAIEFRVPGRGFS